jgi:hypothetical protein
VQKHSPKQLVQAGGLTNWTQLEALLLLFAATNIELHSLTAPALKDGVALTPGPSPSSTSLPPLATNLLSASDIEGEDHQGLVYLIRPLLVDPVAEAPVAGENTTFGDVALAVELAPVKTPKKATLQSIRVFSESILTTLPLFLLSYMNLYIFSIE